MAKAPQASPERAELQAAHQRVAAAQQAVTDAEDGYRQALVAWGEAGVDADKLELQISRLQDRRDPGINEVRLERAREVAAVAEQLKVEQEKLSPYAQAKDAAKDRIRPAQ